MAYTIHMEMNESDIKKQFFPIATPCLTSLLLLARDSLFESSYLYNYILAQPLKNLVKMLIKIFSIQKVLVQSRYVVGFARKRWSLGKFGSFAQEMYRLILILFVQLLDLTKPAGDYFVQWLFLSIYLSYSCYAFQKHISIISNISKQYGTCLTFLSQFLSFP